MFPTRAGILSFAGVNTNKGLSPALWGDCELYKHGGDLNDWRYFGDSFDRQAGAALATNHALFGPWDGFGTTGVTFVAEQAVDGGVVATVDADTEEAYLGYGIYGGPRARFVKGTDGDFYYESRVAFSSIASTAGIAKFVGLYIAGSAPATGRIASGGASIANAKYIGFRALIADGDGMDCVYNTSAAEVVVKEAADESALNITADTFTKFGLRWRARTGKLEYLINGVVVAEIEDTSAAASFPDATTDLFVPFNGVRDVGVASAITMKTSWAWGAQRRAA